MALKGKEQGKDLDVIDNPQVGLEAQVPSVAPRSKRQARQAEPDGQAEDPYLDSVKSLDDILLKFKKYTKSISSTENGVFGSLSSCFKSKNERVNAYSFACSSFTDKIEEYFYNPENSFPYKRGVKLVPKDNSIYVEASADTDVYGICVDVCEFSCTAYVLPITNNFEGYLVTRNPHIKSGEILDISNKGVIIKAGGGPPTMINAYALSDAFTINFMPEDEDLKQSKVQNAKKEEYSINLVKVAIFGNRGLEKIIVPNASDARLGRQ
ncbi:DUF228 domain-containing protein [Borreliella burgdorferi]|uniref:DUF228 domain-containing protein n=1 Tax=Borreliella burgdorferi TaxID=139 RepID=UPI00017F41D8|nr:DUF228 domain-containing protein [Borreliella burgdorferi]ACN56108.1 conserved hypothetical protein [Borreliella burgdorferi CA-11.2A]MCD2385013.1 DUF228 domain-containing protein [Borreliella burgdorferi]MCD2387575.1 DUF228 domain-containing protein [Borreliella burgdorferi]MCD2391024.1 DUF228 domain-containing protein [Borreliella burgdorferi]MCD2393599.1 DUF228 domain-containing protein [Borreliella burgdorferi]